MSLAITKKKCAVIMRLRQDSFCIFSGPNFSFVSCRKASCIRQKADVMHGYPMSHIIEPMTLGRISLRLYASMNKEAALDAPSKHKNILIVDINGLVDMRDLKFRIAKNV